MIQLFFIIVACVTPCLPQILPQGGQFFPQINGRQFFPQNNGGQVFPQNNAGQFFPGQFFPQNNRGQFVSQNAQEARPLADANTDFALRFYNQIAASGNGNIIFSPFSITMALTMAATGAAGSTLTEMYRTLGYSNLEERNVLDMTRKLLTILNADGKQYTMKVANKLFGQQTTTFKQDFLAELQNIFDSPLEKVDFAGNSEGVRQRINRWVEQQTNNKIKDLIKPGSLDAATLLFLVNAIYFKGDWNDKFEERSNLVNQDFYVSNSQTNKVTYMTKYMTKYPYAELPELDAKMLELPYKDDTVSMYVLLPNSVEGIRNVERNLNMNQLQTSNPGNIFSRLYTTDVNLRFPKFELTETIQPKAMLEAMGMAEAFNRPDFSRMGDGPLKISDVVHKAYINVNEEGTEAAAATGILVATYSAGPVAKQFFADHPFIYFIREKSTGSILFMGRYVADGAVPSSGQAGTQGQGPFIPQLGPILPQNGPSFPQLAPNTPQNGPSFPQLAPNTPQNGPSIQQWGSRPQNVPSIQQWRPTIPQNGPSIQQWRPNIQQNGATRPQNRPSIQQWRPTIPQNGATRPQNRPSIQQWRPSFPQNGQTQGINRPSNLWWQYNRNG